MENIFDLIDIENTIHNPYFKKWPYYEDPADATGATWSIIAAHADSFCYNYDYLAHFINEKNKTCGWGADPFYHHPVPIPTKLEFLEILEFRESELERYTNEVGAKEGIIDWNWPPSWGNIHWNCPIVNCRVAIDHVINGCKCIYAKGEKKVWFDLQYTRNAIMVHKILMGHLSPLDISSFELHRNLSLILNIFYKTKNFRTFEQGNIRYSFKITPNMVISPILTSYDLPPLLKKRKRHIEDQPKIRWDIDELLGLYEQNATQYKSSFSPLFECPKQAPQILIYERGIKYCAKETGLSEDILRQIIIIHELSHWAVHRLQDTKGNIWENELFDSTHKDVHEGWAQLLTYWALDYLKDTESMEVFEKLNKNQSSSYQKYKEILSRCNDKEKILDSLISLRIIKSGASFEDWLNLL